MDDPRPRIIPDKPVNLSQLDAEMGEVGLSRNVETGEIVAPDTVSQQQLDDAVAAHGAAFPSDPDDELDAALAAIDTSTVSDTATRDVLDAVVASLRGRAGRDGRAAGRRP